MPTARVSRLNREAARQRSSVEPEFFDFIETALRYTHESGGAFDITVGPSDEGLGVLSG